MAETTWVALLDCNNFFVSCERLFRPDLRGVPVIVMSSNDGCVVARSQEVKDMSIPMGIPIFQIKDIIKDKGIITFSSNLTLYRDVSRRVMGVLAATVTLIDQYSIDESFFVLKGEYDEVCKRAAEIKDIIERAVGVPVSIGVAATKTRAKYANVLAKRSSIGVAVLSSAYWNAEVGNVPISTIWGVGRQLSKHFTQYQLATVGALVHAPRERVEELCGVHGVRLWHELRGEVVYPVTSKRDLPKSIMSSRSFATATTTTSVLVDALYYHIEQVAHDARRQGLLAGYVRVWAYPSRHGIDVGQGGVLTQSIVPPTAATGQLLKIAEKLLHTIIIPGVLYKKLGVELSQLSPADATAQLSLLDLNDVVVQADVSDVLDAIIAVHGDGVLQYGRVKRAALWQSRSDVRSPRYTTEWRDVPVVKA